MMFKTGSLSSLLLRSQVRCSRLWIHNVGSKIFNEAKSQTNNDAKATTERVRNLLILIICNFKWKFILFLPSIYQT